MQKKTSSLQYVQIHSRLQLCPTQGWRWLEGWNGRGKNFYFRLDFFLLSYLTPKLQIFLICHLFQFFLLYLILPSLQISNGVKAQTKKLFCPCCLFPIMMFPFAGYCCSFLYFYVLQMKKLKTKKLQISSRDIIFV